MGKRASCLATLMVQEPASYGLPDYSKPPYKPKHLSLDATFRGQPLDVGPAGEAIHSRLTGRPFVFRLGSR